MHNIQDTPANIRLTQGYNMTNKATIKRFGCDWAKRTLGCHICPEGNMTHADSSADTEYSVKHTFAINWAISVNATNLTRQEAHMAYHGGLNLFSNS